MSNGNSQTTSTSIGHSETSGHSETIDFDLPADVPTLVAMRSTIEQKIGELRSTGAETLRTLLKTESAALGMTPDEVLHGSGKKPRAHKPRTKRDE